MTKSIIQRWKKQQKSYIWKCKRALIKSNTLRSETIRRKVHSRSTSKLFFLSIHIADLPNSIWINQKQKVWNLDHSSVNRTILELPWYCITIKCIQYIEIHVSYIIFTCCNLGMFFGRILETVPTRIHSHAWRIHERP